MKIINIVFTFAMTISGNALADENTSQKINYFTSEWWIVYLTAALSIFTLGLMFYTAKMWRATVNLSKESKANVEYQRAESARALTASEKSADAAQQSADISVRALSISQRAFVFWKGFSCGPHLWHEKVKEYVVFAEVENVGHTPAIDVCLAIRVQTVRGSAPQPPVFSLGQGFREASTVLGPRASGRSSFATIPIEDLIACWEHKCEIYVWSLLNYRDIFDEQKIHHHEQCAKVELIHEPTTVPPEGHPPYLQFRIFGPQNTTS